jgi:hypothetical protein
MKTRFKSIFNLFMLLTLLTIFASTSPAISAQAESLDRPLYANGDFVWAKSIAGSFSYGYDEGRSIVTDTNNNIYTTGFFSYTADFDPGAGIFNLGSAGGPDVFISKLDSNGNFVWAKGMGGTDADYGYDVAIDANGNVYTTGFFSGTADFDPSPNTFNLTSAGYWDIFISKLDNNGNFIWAKRVGGNWLDEGRGIATDTGGNVYVTGSFESSVDFDPGPGTFNLDDGAFVLKLDNNGNFVWAKNLAIAGNAGYGYGYDITLDLDANVYTTGYFANTADFDPGTGIFNMTSVGSNDIYISKLDSNGNFIWAKSMGGGDGDSGISITVDSHNNVYTTGTFFIEADFDPGLSTYNLTSLGQADVFVSKLDSNGNFVWARSMGGEWSDSGRSITVDKDSNVYTTGTVELTADFDPGPGIFNVDRGIFVSKLDSNGNFVWAKNMGWSIFNVGYGVTLDSNDNVYTTGTFRDTADFDPGPNTYYITSSGDTDIFISKLGEVVPNSAKEIIAFKFTSPAAVGAIAGTNINVTVPMGTDVTALVATFTTTGASVTVSGVPQVSGTTPNDFTNPVIYRVTATDASTQDYTVTVAISNGGTPTFTDVPFSHPLHDYIEALYQAGYTAGCSTNPLMYCPDTILDRAQSAVFMLRGQMGSTYSPPPVPWDTFTDDWTGFEWAEPWAEGMWQEGLTAGCQTSPLMYCPATQLPRVEASVFGLRMKYGVNYTPPAGTGTIFADMTDTSYWGIGWAEQAYLDGLLPACGTDSVTGKPLFCPSELVDRAWGAYLIVKAKNIPLP